MGTEETKCYFWFYLQLKAIPSDIALDDILKYENGKKTYKIIQK
jgi:hypothetical protein